MKFFFASKERERSRQWRITVHFQECLRGIKGAPLNYDFINPMGKIELLDSRNCCYEGEIFTSLKHPSI